MGPGNFTTSEQESISPTGFNIDTAEMTSNSGHVFEFKDLIQQVQIIENMEMKSILALVFIEDPINLGAEVKLAGNENVRIILSRIEPGDKEKLLALNLQIADITNYSEPSPSSQAYTLICVSKHSYLNNKKLLNRPFNGQAKDLIKDIVESNLESKIDVQDSSKGLLKGIYPNLRPYDAIEWLMRNAVIDDSPMFFYETAKDGLILTSYSHLLKRKNKPFNVYNKNPFFFGTMDNKKPDEVFEEEKLKIRKFNSHMDLSKLSPAEAGVFGSTIKTIDISTKTTNEHTFSWLEEPLRKYLNDFPAVAPEMKILDSDSSLFDLNKTNIYYQSLNENAFDKGNNYHASTDGNGLLKAFTAGALLHQFRIEMDLAGDFEMTPGNIIELETLKHADIKEEVDSEEDFMDEYTSGKYLVYGVEHTFNRVGYSMKVKAIKDSLLTYPIDDIGDA